LIDILPFAGSGNGLFIIVDGTQHHALGGDHYHGGLRRFAGIGLAIAAGLSAQVSNCLKGLFNGDLTWANA